VLTMRFFFNAILGESCPQSVSNLAVIFKS
jgi:hypothetical protein